MNTILGLCGMAGAFLCIIGDLLLDLKGKDNSQLGKNKLINTSWDHMHIKRFVVSIFLAAFGAPLSFLGFMAMADQIHFVSLPLANAMWMVGLFGCAGGTFIHIIICVFPVIYKTMKPHHSIEEIDRVINGVYDAVKVPFWLLYFVLIGVSSCIVIYAIFKEYLHLSYWCMLLTPLSTTLIGLLLRALFPRTCYDLPGIILPSTGLGMIGLLAILNAL